MKKQTIKKKMALLPLMLSLFAIMASCDNDSDTLPENKFPEKIYTANNGLGLTYSGQPMKGKTVRFIPDAEDATKAKLVIYSTFSPLSVFTRTADLSNGIAGSGILPGSPEETLEVTLVTDVDSAGFAGDAATNHCTYAYDGNISASGLSLNIKDVQLNNQRLCGRWAFPAEASGTDKAPIHFVWESNAQISILGMPMSMADFFELLMALQLFNDGQTTIPDMLTTTLKEAKLMEDGNVIASYLAEGEVPEYKDSPMNMIQYMVNGDGQLLCFLNPEVVAAAQSTRAGETASIDINALLGNIISMVTRLAPMVSEGIPLEYTLTDDNLEVYMDTELLLPLLKENVVPLLSDEAIVQKMVDMAAKNPSMELIAPVLPEIIASLIDVINGTTKVEIGLSLTKSKSPASV